MVGFGSFADKSNHMQSAKDLYFSEDGRKRLIDGITKISNAVKSTLGPRGNTVLIESPEHIHGITVTKDGVTVAKSISLVDPVENLAVRMMKEAAERTASSAGDGTTTAIVLTEALVSAGTNLLVGDVNRTEVLRHLVNETKKIAKLLKKRGKQLDGGMLRDVAIISANNDIATGDMIAKLYEEVGHDGVVTVEKSKTTDTYYETTKGIKVKRGYTSHLFINDHKHDECVYEDVYVLVSDIEINNILQIENVLKPIINEGKKLMIVAPCSQAVITTLAANVLKNNLKFVNILPPDFGYRRSELMNDIALSVGATYFSEGTGDDLSIITSKDLGHCSKVIVGRDETIIIKDEDCNTEEINKRVSELQAAHAISTRKQDKDFILQRIASLTGGIGVICVGGNTDLEQKELYDRVDDAVCAVRSALEEGILAGGGLMLYSIAKSYAQKTTTDGNKRIAYQILSNALRAPLVQILENAGLDVDVVYKDHKGWMYGYDVKGERYGYLIKLGVIDPVKVTRSALQNAVSVAVTILSTNAIVTMART